jgi:hypothetical protein
MNYLIGQATPDLLNIMVQTRHKYLRVRYIKNRSTMAVEHNQR